MLKCFLRNNGLSVLLALGLLGLTLPAPAAPVISNPSFEVDDTPGYPGYFWAITDWTSDPPSSGGTGNTGLNDSGGPFHDNGLIPDGAKVAFIQNVATLTQSVDGFEAGKQYLLTYFENARTGPLVPTGQVSLGGTVLVPEHAVPPVGPGHSYHFKSATFASPGAGAFDLTLGQTNASGDTTICYDMINIAEVGSASNLLVGTKAVDFGPVTVGQGTDATVTLFNTGGSALNVSSLDFSGANKDEFSVVSPTGALSIDAGTTQSIQLHFSPASTGDKAATLTLTSNAPNAATVAIGLAGKGANGVEVVNGSFEDDPNPPSPGIATKVTGWTVGGGCGFMTYDAYKGQDGTVTYTYYDNGLCPDGVKAAFIQGNSKFSQSVPGFVAGQAYDVSIWVNARAWYDTTKMDTHAPAPFQCTLGSLTLFNSDPPLNILPVEAGGSFTVPFLHYTQTIIAPASGNMDLVIADVNPAGDITLIFDDVAITPHVNASKYWSVYQ